MWRGRWKVVSRRSTFVMTKKRQTTLNLIAHEEDFSLSVLSHCRVGFGTTIGSLNGAPPGATVSDSAPSSSAPFETAANVSSGKAGESRGSVATGSGVVRSNGAASTSDKSMGTNLPRPVSGEAVYARSGIDAAGTLVMNSPASDNAKRLSSSSQSALPPVENAPLRDSRPKPVPKPAGGVGRPERQGGGASGDHPGISRGVASIAAREISTTLVVVVVVVEGDRKKYGRPTLEDLSFRLKAAMLCMRSLLACFCRTGFGSEKIKASSSLPFVLVFLSGY